MKLEFYEGTNPAAARLAQAFFKSPLPGQKFKFVALRDGQTGEAETSIFINDEHAAVIADKLGLPLATNEAVKAEVRAHLVTAGIILDGNITLGSESVERLFGITEDEQRVRDGAEIVRGELEALLSA